MQIIYLTIGVLCLVMIFYGAKWLLRSKTIYSFRISNEIEHFIVKKTGAHSLCTEGGYFGEAKKYDFLISKDSDSKIIEIKENFLKWRFRKKGQMFIEHSLFNISEIGNYNIRIDLKNHNQELNDLIIIKESVSITKKILSILFLVIGVNGSFWGILLSMNPTVFIN